MAGLQPLPSEVLTEGGLVLSLLIHISFLFLEGHPVNAQSSSSSFRPFYIFSKTCINLLNPTGQVMHQQFNIQLLYVLPTLYLCVLYLSENKQRLVPLTA